jgi:Predicted membrane protein
VILHVVVATLAGAGIYAAAAGAREAALLLLSASGLVHTLFNKPQALCGKVRRGGCEVVLASPYARPFGINLEYLGAAWFAGVLPSYYLGFGQAWGLLALLAVVALVGIEVKLRAFCIYCTIAHVIGVAAALLLLGL